LNSSFVAPHRHHELAIYFFLGEKTCYNHVSCKRNKVGNERRRGGVDVVVKVNVERLQRGDTSTSMFQA
jgi:hypothetical protein